MRRQLEPSRCHRKQKHAKEAQQSKAARDSAKKLAARVDTELGLRRLSSFGAASLALYQTERCGTFKEQRLCTPHRVGTCASMMLEMCSTCLAVQQACADQNAIHDSDSLTALATKLSKAAGRTDLGRPDCVGLGQTAATNRGGAHS